MSISELTHILSKYPPHTKVTAFNADAGATVTVTGLLFTPEKFEGGKRVCPTLEIHTDEL